MNVKRTFTYTSIRMLSRIPCVCQSREPTDVCNKCIIYISFVILDRVILLKSILISYHSSSSSLYERVLNIHWRFLSTLFFYDTYIGRKRWKSVQIDVKLNRRRSTSYLGLSCRCELDSCQVEVTVSFLRNLFRDARKPSSVEVKIEVCIFVCRTTTYVRAKFPFY